MATLNPISASAGGREHAFVCTPIPRFTQSESYGSSFELYIEAKSYQQGKGGIREAEALVLLDDEGACQFSVKSSFPIRYTDLHGNVHLSVRWRSMISVWTGGEQWVGELMREQLFPAERLSRCQLTGFWRVCEREEIERPLVDGKHSKPAVVRRDAMLAAALQIRKQVGVSECNERSSSL
eukprot:scaffold211317_cov34-Tisochrysis_lutea.AAC.1